MGRLGGRWTFFNVTISIGVWFGGCLSIFVLPGIQYIYLVHRGWRFASKYGRGIDIIEERKMDVAL